MSAEPAPAAAAVAAVADAHLLFDAETIYLDTASYGLPPRPAFEALEAALRSWRSGRGSWPAWAATTEAARALFARMVSAPVESVAIGSSVSSLVGLLAASLPAGTRVLVPDCEFTSNLFPWLAQRDRGVEVITVPAPQLRDHVRHGIDVVAFSLVQSSDGALADIDDVLAAARGVGARTVADATQAAGWLELDARRFDAVVCAAYKWLLSPRGSAFMTLGEDLAEAVRPHGAGWYAGEDVHESYYGPPLRLAGSARRFDVSPAWFSWVGTVPALELLLGLGVARVGAHDVGLANRFREGLGLPAAASAIVSADMAGAGPRLDRAGIVASVRSGRLRMSFHVHNTADDVERALDALDGLPRPGAARGAERS